MGETLVKLGFEGEIDFHLMDVGYYSHAIYVLNPQPNSQLSTGLYYSLDDDGNTGNRARCKASLPNRLPSPWIQIRLSVSMLPTRPACLVPMTQDCIGKSLMMASQPGTLAMVYE